MEFTINSKIVKNVLQLRKQIEGSVVSEIRITNDTFSCYDKEGRIVDLKYDQGITTEPMEQARLSLFLNDLWQMEVPMRVLDNVKGETWEDQITLLRDKIKNTCPDPVNLLQYYYLL
ncbi:4825_t:CDS:1, partial [Scutellospora calospora]